MKLGLPRVLGLGLLPLASTVHAQFPVGEGPALGPNRITQAQIESGQLGVDEIRLAGFRIFSTPFNKFDGFGDGPMDLANPDRTSPGNRPTLANNGTFLRINGLDTQACLECHGIVSNATIPSTFGVGGVGGIAASAMPAVTEIDIDDEANNGFAAFNGRLINPPFVFGAGGVELVAKEMTVELQALKAQAQATPDTDIPLIAKGVSFGTIRFDSATSSFDTSGVEGIDDDLAVKPFGRKGDNLSVRAFDIGAFQFHQGIQPVEVVGAGVDGDEDGVVDELLIGELSAVHIYSVALDRPRRPKNISAAAQSGFQVFSAIGCATCHVPSIETNTTMLPIAFPEVATDPFANVFFEVDLTARPTRFEPSGAGVAVNMFSDLKRHDMGPGLAEMTGGPLDPFFITPRLWGLADTAPYMHDGRAQTITEAIELHGGDGQFAADNFAVLTNTEKLDLLAFLRTLRTPRNPSADLHQANQTGLLPRVNVSLK